jgi:class 3 adenylate cyclase/tetratricopeptide (TPR) repeat protein
MTCGSCGTPLVPGARFCFHCGAPQQVPASIEDAERRIVTVLFGDLSEFTAWAEDLDPERVGVVTDRLLAALAAAVTAVDGHVDKLTGDGIMAVFGAPVSHEDDAERAVLAAAAMQLAVTHLVQEETGGGGRRLGLRVGLNTGEVLAGVQAQVSYTVVGDAVNTASRLSDAAGVGAVYAGRATAAATMTVASWRTLPPLRLKGKRETVEAYELVSLRSTGSSGLGVGDEAPIIGREAELGALVGRLQSVRDSGRASGVLVVGEAGIGKTRLVRELTHFAGEIPGARVLRGQCRPFGLGRDLAPLAQIVRAACDVAAGDPAEVIRERVARTVAQLALPRQVSWTPATLAEQLLALLGLAADADGTGRDGDLTPGLRVDRPDVDGVVALVSSLAADDEPVVLVVDDLHLARRPLLEALGEVVARVSGPVLYVGVGRPPQGDDGWSHLGVDQVLPVGPLDRAAAERLLRAYLGGAELGESAKEALVGRADGNPFFLGELLHLLVDRGLLVSSGDRWTMREEIPADLLPAGVQAVLAARIDSLDPAARALLRDASVFGSDFPADALAYVDPRVDPATVVGLVDTLVGRGMLSAVGNGRFTFAHTLARDVAYAGLPKIERARRHAGAARWAAEHGEQEAGDADAVAAVQADRSLRLAGEMGLAADDPVWQVAGPGLAAALRLGRAALARDDTVSAETHLVRALRLAAATVVGEEAVDPRLIGPVQVAYAEALAGQRRIEEAEAALTGPLRSGDPAVRGAALLVRGDLRRKQADDAGARQSFVEAFVTADAAGDERVTGGALRQLGLLDMLEGRLSDAEQRFSAAIGLAESAGDERGAGWALQHLAWSATTRADYAVVEDALARASEVFGRLQDVGGLAWCAGSEALLRLLQGRLGEARDLVAGLLPVAEQLGDVWETAAGRVIAAIAAAELGELDWAGEQVALAAAGFEEIGDGWGRAMAAIGAGIVARGVGHTRDARTALRRAAGIAAAGGHHALELLASVVLGLVHLDREDIRAAGQAADRAEEIAARLDLAETAGSAQLVLRAQVLRARDRLDEARTLLEAAARADQPTFLFPRRQAVAHLAGVLLQAGDLDAARVTIERALQIPAEDVRSHVVAGRVLAQVLAAAGDVDGAAVAGAAALTLVEESGLVGELAATRRVTGRVGRRS